MIYLETLKSFLIKGSPPIPPPAPHVLYGRRESDRQLRDAVGNRYANMAGGRGWLGWLNRGARVQGDSFCTGPSILSNC